MDVTRGVQAGLRVLKSNGIPPCRLKLQMKPSDASIATRGPWQRFQKRLKVTSTSDKEEDKVFGPWLIVGLGNPGKKYEGTRHNIGSDFLDHLAQTEGISMTAMQCRSLVGKGRICGVPVLLAKPQTYMNLSGDSIRPLAQFYKVPSQRVLSIYDDLDLDLGALKLLPKGGHGGHNGMKSLIQNFGGSKDFPRLRMGIGRPPGDMATAVFVLQRFGPRERQEVEYVYQRGLSAVRSIMLDGLDKTISSWNSPKLSQIYTK